MVVGSDFPLAAPVHTLITVGNVEEKVLFVMLLRKKTRKYVSGILNIKPNTNNVCYSVLVCLRELYTNVQIKTSEIMANQGLVGFQNKTNVYFCHMPK